MNINTFYKSSNSRKTENQIYTQVSFNLEHAIYKGHFPDNPVVPGIMQIEIIKHIFETEYSKSLQLKKVTSIKFLNIITPDVDHIEFNISYTLTDNIYKIKCVIKKEETIYTKFSGLFTI